MDLGQILVRRGVLSETSLDEARQAQAARPGQALDRTLLDLGLVDEEQALRALGDELGLRFVDLSKVTIDSQVLRLLPSKLIYRQGVLPIERSDGRLVVATSNPLDLYILDELAALTGLEVEPVLALREEIAKLIRTHFGVGGETIDRMVADDALEIVGGEAEVSENELAEMAQEASVIKLVNEILMEAINDRASDVHIEPQETGLKVRYRIDGLLQFQALPPEINRFQAAIISRLKIMARLNIAEKRLPQDGRIKLRHQGRDIDIRVSIIPMLYGEGIVLRILDKGQMAFNLTNVGMEADHYQTFEELINRPHGIVLLTGPTGSGKTTTLYCALNEIKDETLKIITVEDPVEYHLDGLNQIQVHGKIGLTFAAGLRSILRHDPDVILIGEIRDLETAESAIQASLTGHLVFSTLHTNDSPGAFTRLVNMGVEPFLVASTVEGAMAQRLVRTLCKECKESHRAERVDLPDDFPGKEGVTLYRAKGCRACRETGYAGRIGIFELLVTTDPVRELTVARSSAAAIRAQVLRNGMITLRQDGWRKVLKGLTTIDEVLRVTKGDLS